MFLHDRPSSNGYSCVAGTVATMPVRWTCKQAAGSPCWFERTYLRGRVGVLARLGSCLGSPSRTLMTDQGVESWNHAAASPQKSPSGCVMMSGEQKLWWQNVCNCHMYVLSCSA